MHANALLYFIAATMPHLPGHAGVFSESRSHVEPGPEAVFALHSWVPVALYSGNRLPLI